EIGHSSMQLSADYWPCADVVREARQVSRWFHPWQLEVMSRSTFATGRPFELRSPLPDAAAAEPAPTPPGLLIGYLPLAAAGAPAAELALRQAGGEVIRRESAGEGPVLAALVAFLARGDRLV